jgi:hypothetical protein
MFIYFTAFWNVEQCSPVVIDRRFRGTVSIIRAIIHGRNDGCIHTYETSVYSKTKRRYFPEGSIFILAAVRT